MPRKTTPQQRAPRTAPTPAPAVERWFKITNQAETSTGEIRIRGMIGLPQYERDWYTGEQMRSQGAGTLQEFEAELSALGDVQNLTIAIFSEGGEVFVGMAIANLLQRHKARKTCIIDGLCASAATYIALACDEVQIPANAWMMIHGASGGCWGGPSDLRAYAESLDQINTTAVNLYAARTGIAPDEVRAMLEATTYMDGNTAVELGFADTVIEPLQNLAARAGTLQPTNLAQLDRAPAEVLALFDMSRHSKSPTHKPESMIKPRTPLMNAAEKGVAVSSPGGTPAPTPTAEASPPTPPVQQQAPVPPVAAPPQNVITLTAEQLQAAITTAVTTAVTPLQQRIDNFEQLQRAGITPQNLAGAPPVHGVQSPETPAPINYATAKPMDLIGSFVADAFKQQGIKPPAETR